MTLASKRLDRKLGGLIKKIISHGQWINGEQQYHQILKSWMVGCLLLTPKLCISYVNLVDLHWLVQIEIFWILT